MFVSKPQTLGALLPAQQPSRTKTSVQNKAVRRGHASQSAVSAQGRPAKGCRPGSHPWRRSMEAPVGTPSAVGGRIQPWAPKQQAEGTAVLAAAGTAPEALGDCRLTGLLCTHSLRRRLRIFQRPNHRIGRPNAEFSGEHAVCLALGFHF